MRPRYHVSVSRRAVLWVAFVLVHVTVAILGYQLPNAPMGDVYLVYEPWSGCALFGDLTHCTLSSGSWMLPGITSAWVYPQLALVPMLLAWAFAWTPITYTPAWAIVVALANAGAFAILVGRGRSRGRVAAAWFWLAFILLLGPVGMYRLDGFTVSLVLAGSLWLVGRPWLGSVLLAVAVWMKVWPAAILAAAVIAVRRRLAVIGGALAVTAITLGTIVLLGGGAYALGFVSDQAGRGLQLEAPVSTLYLWRAVWEVPGSFVYYDPEMLTFQVTGPNVDPVIALMTPVLVIAVAAVAGLGGYKAWRGASYVRLFPPLSLALVLAFIVFNKVGSPQYVVWIAAPLAVGLVLDRRQWRWPATLGLGVALLTQLVYPLVYGGLMLKYPLPFPAVLLTARNALLVVLLVWAVARLLRVPRRVAAGPTVDASPGIRAADLSATR